MNDDPNSVEGVLQSMLDTRRERNAVYGNAPQVFGELLQLLHGPGRPVSIAQLNDTTGKSAMFGVYVQVLGKLVRFAETGCTHVDSIHDFAVYSAMLESMLRQLAAQQSTEGSA